MNTLDWICLAVLALLGIRCMIKGFVAEVLSVAALLVGVLAALLLYKRVGQLFVGFGLSPKPEIVPAILGFAVVFLLAFIAVKLVERLLEDGIEAAELGGVDRGLGLALGLAEGLILISLLLVAGSLLEPVLTSVAGYSRLLHTSAFAKILLPIVGPEVVKATQGIKLNANDLKLQLQAPAITKP